MSRQQIERADLYPMLFEPIYKEVLWGGTKMTSVLKRNVPTVFTSIGEAWDICDRPGVESTVINGSLAGMSLHRLVQLFGQDFVGASFRGARFPVMVKIIDAGKQLSLQVHPGENALSRLAGEAEAKTEMWYVIDADPHAKLFAGLKSSATKQTFQELLYSPDIENMLQCFDGIPGDAFFINAGRIHAIGAGNLLLEVQSNSDTTYRVTDWGRVDKLTGKLRKLHVDEAMICMDFMDRTVSRISGATNYTGHNRKYPLINRCPYFHCDDLKLVGPWRDSTENTRSFHILTAINAPFAVENDRYRTEVPIGYSVLIPACFGTYIVQVAPEHTTTVIRTTL